MRSALRTSLLIFVLALTVAELPAATLTVFAAASLTDALKQLAPDYERKTGDKLVFNLGASSTLARQIEEGAPADVFFSADEARMDALERKGLILKETRKSRLSNSLVIVVARDKGAAIHDAKDLGKEEIKRVALAEPRTVPAGIYAQQYLQRQNLWSTVQSKVIPTESVRAALAAVEAGNVDAGIVYKTDATISKNVSVAYEVPLRDCPVISYPMAVMKESRNPQAGKRLIEYLDSPEAAKVFQQFGFIVQN